MTKTESNVERVVGPNGKSPVSFHDAWPLSQSEVVFQKHGISPTRGEDGYYELAQPITYASSF